MGTTKEVSMGSKSVAPVKNGRSGPAGWLTSAKDYVEGLKKEMRMVTWPTWEQVRATTGVVIAAVFVFAAYFAIVDFVIGRGITQLFLTLGK